MNCFGAISQLPPWLRVAAVQNFAQAGQFALVVDIGEAEAIELAIQLRAERLLIDERKGRRLATNEDVPTIGLLGCASVPPTQSDSIRSHIPQSN